MRQIDAEVEVDARGRISIGKLAPAGHRYRVTRLEDGELLLTPVISVSQRELAMLGNPAMLERLRRSVASAKAGQVKRFGPGHFTQLVDQMGGEENDE